MSGASVGGASATSAGGPAQIDVDDELLAYTEEIGEDDITAAAGKDGAEKTLQTMRKRDKHEGLIAAPMITMVGGKPDSVSWCLGGIQSSQDHLVYEDGKFKWNGHASSLFVGAPEGWYIR